MLDEQKMREQLELYRERRHRAWEDKAGEEELYYKGVIFGLKIALGED